eukprot:5212569-Pyramimonas_sp.AAC.1
MGDGGSKLECAVSAMTPARAKRLLERVTSRMYQAVPFARMAGFVRGLVAICFMLPAAMRRRTGKGAT